MRAAWWRVAAVALVVGIGSSAVADAARATDGWVSFTDRAVGIRVSIPRSWHTVPPTVAGVRTEITRLERQNNAALAQVYASFVATAAARAQMLRYLFQAFEYVPSATQQPDFALAYARTTKQAASNMAVMANSVAKSYGGQTGVTVTNHGVVQLPAGPAAFVAGTQLGQQFEIYVLGHGTLLFDLSFRADANTPGAAAAFAEIAHRFAFT